MDPKQIYIELCIEEINIINKNIDRNRYKPKHTDLYFLNHMGLDIRALYTFLILNLFNLLY